MLKEGFMLKELNMRYIPISWRVTMADRLNNP